jgi:hypothetical protein
VCDGYGIWVTPRSRRAYLALSAEASRVGWPAHYKRDLTYWDRNALDGRDPALPFVWVLRECGTYLVAPTQQRRNLWTGELIGDLSAAIDSGRGMLRALAREGGHRFYWWDGSRLREVSPDDAIELFAEACCREGNVAAEDRAASDGHRCGGDSQVQPAQPTPEAIVGLDSPGNYYWTVVIPYAGERATQWHPTEATGPFSILTRGVFSSAQLAHDWARAKLGGHPYSLRPYAVGPVSCVALKHATPCAAVGILATTETDGPKEYALCADHAHTITEGCHAGDWEFSTFAPVASGGDS